MKKLLCFAFIFLISVTPIFAYEYNLLTKKERVTAEAIPVTSADIVNVAKAEVVPIGLILFIILAITYSLAIYFRLKLKQSKDWAEQLQGYKKFLPHIVRATVGISLLWIGLNKSFFLITAPFALQIAFIVGAAFILLGIGIRFSSAAVIILLGFTFTEGYIPFLASLELAGLAVVMVLMPANPLSLDNLFGIKFKTYPSAEHHSFAVLRIIVGASLIWNAYFTLTNPQFALILIDKISFLATLLSNPESIIFYGALVEILIGILLLVGFLTRFHAGMLAVIGFIVFFSITAQGLAILPLLGSGVILMIADPHKWSVDELLPK